MMISGNSLEGKVAIVTGAASGMGLAQARLFVANGARVVMADISETVDAAAQALGENAAACRHDVSNEDSWAKVVAFTCETFGLPTILINTAGISTDTISIADTTIEDFERMFRVNLQGVFLGMRTVVEPMTQAGGGAIVNISSIGALTGAEGLSAYSAAKGGVRSLSRVAAREFGKYGIRVNTIYPGGIDTPIVTPELRKVYDEFVAPKLPISRMGRPDEIAQATMFLASDAASYITGADLVVDGGCLV